MDPTTLMPSGWPALVIAGLVIAAYLARLLTKESHWFNTRQGLAVLALGTGLLEGVAVAIQRDGLSWNVLTSAALTTVLSLIALNNPSRSGVRDKEAPSEKGAAHLVVIMSLAIAGLGVAAIYATGCGATARDAAEITKGQASKALTACAGIFDKYDLEQQERVFAEARAGEKVAALERYHREIQKPIRLAFQAFYGALRALTDGLDAYDAGKAQDWGKLVGDVITASVHLADTAKRLGVPINVPKIGVAPWRVDRMFAAYVADRFNPCHWPAMGVARAEVR